MKKVLLVLLILSPSLFYLYIVNRDQPKPAPAKTAQQSPLQQTPDH